MATQLIFGLFLIFNYAKADTSMACGSVKDQSVVITEREEGQFYEITPIFGNKNETLSLQIKAPVDQPYTSAFIVTKNFSSVIRFIVAPSGNVLVAPNAPVILYTRRNYTSNYVYTHLDVCSALSPMSDCKNVFYDSEWHTKFPSRFIDYHLVSDGKKALFTSVGTDAYGYKTDFLNFQDISSDKFVSVQGANTITSGNMVALIHYYQKVRYELRDLSDFSVLKTFKAEDFIFGRGRNSVKLSDDESYFIITSDDSTLNNNRYTTLIDIKTGAIINKSLDTWADQYVGVFNKDIYSYKRDKYLYKNGTKLVELKNGEFGYPLNVIDIGNERILVSWAAGAIPSKLTILTLDLKTGKQNILWTGTDYLGFATSPDYKKFAVVLPDYKKTVLHVLSCEP